MKPRKIIFVLICLMILKPSIHAQKKATPIDSTVYYDELFSELDDFLDSLMAPRNMLIVNVGFSNNNLNYKASANNIRTDRRLNITPSIGYFDKSGLGINGAASLTNINKELTAYQFLLTGSYDYLKSTAFATGISYTKFFSKDSLPFYTSPLENEASLYLTYRGWKIKPTMAATYGWGNQTTLEKREETIKALRLRTGSVTYVSTTQNVSDFSLVASLRYDLYWRESLGKGTMLRLTPQLTLNSGTQKFGFNQVSNSYVTPRGKNAVDVLYNSENLSLDEQTRFQPLSLTAFIKTEIGWKQFYIQPQLAFDYYFPASEKNFSTLLLLNVGAIF